MPELHTHTLVVRDHRISCCDPVIVQHSMGHDAISLDLDDEWAGLSVVLVIAGQTGDAYEVAYTGEPAIIPASLTEETGWLPVGVVGYGDDGKVRVLTAQANRLLRVEPSGPFEGDEPVPDPPDVLGQLLAAAERAESSADDADEAASKASLAADNANAAAERAGKAADLAEDATEAANEAAEDARNAAQAAGEKSLYAYADPDNDELIILEYPAFLESEDGGSVYLTLEGSDN